MPSTCGTSLMAQTYRPPQTTAKGNPPLATALTGCPSRCLAPFDGCCAASASSSARHAGAPSPHYGAGYAGGDVDSGIPTGGLRWSRGTCHRTGCLPTPAVRGRRALHGRTPPGRICLSARPEARQRQRGAVHLVRGPGDGQCRQRGHRRAFTHLVHRSGGASGRDTLRHPACFDRTFARTVAAMEEGATRRRLPGIDMGRADRGAGRQRGHCGQFCNAQRHVAGLSQPGSEPGARHPERIDTETWYPAGPRVPGRCWPSSGSIRTGPWRCSSGESPGKRESSTW